MMVNNLQKPPHNICKGTKTLNGVLYAPYNYGVLRLFATSQSWVRAFVGHLSHDEGLNTTSMFYQFYKNEGKYQPQGRLKYQ